MGKKDADKQWVEAIKRWRKLPAEERRRRHVEAIPRRVANSMAMEGEPVDEGWIRERLARLIQKKPAKPEPEDDDKASGEGG